MQKRNPISSVILIASGLILVTAILGGCAVERGIQKMRAQRFSQPREGQTTVSVKARATYLQATANGDGLSAESIAAANELLTAQGPIRRQILTIIPLSPAGKRIAPHLVKALQAAGAPSPQSGSYEVAENANSEAAKALAEQQQGWDIELVSEAVVVEVPDTTIANPDGWALSPYYSVGTLGVATQANIAMMVSDPRDLVRPKTLAPTEGKIAASALDRYLNDDLKDLLDIDFSGEE